MASGAGKRNRESSSQITTRSRLVLLIQVRNYILTEIEMGNTYPFSFYLLALGNSIASPAWN